MNWLIWILFSIYRKCLRHSKITIVISCLIIIVSLFGAAKLKKVTVLDEMLDSDFQATIELSRLKSLFNDANQFIFVLENKNPFTNEELCAINNVVKELLNTFPYVTKIQSPFSVRKATFNEKENTLWYPTLLANVCESTDQDFLKSIHKEPWKGTLLPSQMQIHDLMFELYLNLDFKHDQVPILKDWITKKFINNNLKIHFSGEADFQYYTNVGYQWIEMLNLLILVVLIGLCWLFFRSFLSGIILIASLIVTNIILRGIMGYAEVSVDILSSNIFLMLTISCIEDYMLVSSLRMKSDHWQTPFRDVLVPGFLTSLTTLIGFWSLGTSDIGMIRRFGWLAGIGAMIEWGFIFLLLPSLMKEWTALRNWVTPPYFSFWSKFEHSLKFSKPPRYVMLLLLLVFPIGIWAAHHLNYQENPEDTFWKTHPFRQGLNYIESSRGYRSKINLIFENKSNNEKKIVLERWLAQQKEIAIIEKPDKIIHLLFEEVPTKFEQAFSSEVKNSSAFNRWIAETGEERWIIYWNDTETYKMAHFIKEVRKICQQDCFIAGSFAAYAELGTGLSSTLLESLFTSLALVGAVLAWIAYSQGFRKFWVLWIAAFWGTFFTISILWLTHTKIYFITCLFASVLVGLSGDNIIQYLWDTRKKSRLEQLENMGLGTGLLTISIIFMSLCFLGAYFVPARSLGVLLACGLTAMFFGDYFIWKEFQDDHQSS